MAGFDRLTPEGRRFFAQMDELKKMSVHVGYQAGEATSDDGVDMCDIAMWNELGTESTPARPFLRKSMDENGEKIGAFCQSEIQKVAQGGTAQSALEALGVFGKGLVQEKISTGDFEPNAPSTIRKKGSDKPLIDTGRLRQSVNYIIKPKGGD